MFGTLVRRERRALWGSLTLIIVIAIGGSLYAAARSRARLVQQAQTDATLAARTQLAPILMPRDLMGPITGTRAEQLGTLIQEQILSAGPVTSVRLYSELGRIVYDHDPNVVTVKPSYVRELVYEVANGDPTSQVHDGSLLTYVPLWTNPGGQVVVAEMRQDFGPIASEATAAWYRLTLGLAIALVAVLTLLVASATPGERVPSIRAVQTHPEFVAVNEARRTAEQRAKATEVALKELQKQFRSVLDDLKAMEAMVQMSESQTTHTTDELHTLRNQVRDTAERLHKAELDNNALRERLALRQGDLDEHKARLATLEARPPGAEIEELRSRVEVAERRATEMENEIDRLQAELDSTSDRFHLAKLSEALREFDNDEPAEDDLFEHPKIVFTVPPSRATTPWNGR